MLNRRGHLLVLVLVPGSRILGVILMGMNVVFLLKIILIFFELGISTMRCTYAGFLRGKCASLTFV
jgi:hypothetical protein